MLSPCLSAYVRASFSPISFALPYTNSGSKRQSSEMIPDGGVDRGPKTLLLLVHTTLSICVRAAASKAFTVPTTFTNVEAYGFDSALDESIVAKCMIELAS